MSLLLVVPYDISCLSCQTSRVKILSTMVKHLDVKRKVCGLLTSQWRYFQDTDYYGRLDLPRVWTVEILAQYVDM